MRFAAVCVCNMVRVGIGGIMEVDRAISPTFEIP